MWEHLNHKEQQEGWRKGTKSQLETMGELRALEKVLRHINRFWGVGGGFAEGRKRCKERKRERMSKKIELSKNQQSNGEEKEQHVAWGCRVF